MEEMEGPRYEALESQLHARDASRSCLSRGHDRTVTGDGCDGADSGLSSQRQIR